jgi:enamine deaminase RidA (YjgF/YER057c/UK114 family)
MNASLKDVVRTRVYVSNAEHWEAIARVHGKRFAEIKPANTLIIAKLIGDEYLVEVEMDALIDD